jgi:hypothetical protein
MERIGAFSIAAALARESGNSRHAKSGMRQQQEQPAWRLRAFLPPLFAFRLLHRQSNYNPTPFYRANVRQTQRRGRL